MIYIGIDLHARRFSMAVLDQDNSIIFEETLPTSSQNLTAAVSAFAEGKSVVFEESTLAAWAYRVLARCGDEVVVADPLHNHWIAQDEKGNDITAARKLAQLLRAGLGQSVPGISVMGTSLKPATSSAWRASCPHEQ